MLSYERFIASIGEVGVQALIERMERYEGVSANEACSLEERWRVLMAERPDDHANAA